MREVITAGGDTDTNACIVGGLIGAALGFKVIFINLILLLKILFSNCHKNKLLR